MVRAPYNSIAITSTVSLLEIIAYFFELTHYVDIPIVDAALAKQVNATDIVRSLLPRYTYGL